MTTAADRQDGQEVFRLTEICRYGPWVKFGFVYNPLFKGLVWFWRDDRGIQDRWACRTLGMDGVQ